MPHSLESYKTSRQFTSWMERIILNGHNLFEQYWKKEERSVISLVQDQVQRILVLKHGIYYWLKINLRVLHLPWWESSDMKSNKQSVVARSNAVAEFRAMADGECELLWINIVLADLKIKWEDPMRLYCDNKHAINIVHNPVQHGLTKHIEIDRHVINKNWKGVDLYTICVYTRLLADVLTKGLSGSGFQSIISKLGNENINIYSKDSLRGECGKIYIDLYFIMW